MKDWTPARTGAGFEFSPILKPLEPFRDQLNVVTGLTNDGENGHSAQHGDVAERHVPGQGQRHPPGHDGRSDHRAADRPGHAVPVARAGDRGSLGHLGSCAGDYLCSYMNTIVVAHADAAAADGDQPARRVRADVRRRRRHARRSGGRGWSRTPASSTRSARASPICSAAWGHATAPSSTEYLDNVREIERRIQQAEQQRTEHAARCAADADRRAGVCEEHVKLMFDLMALAFQADITRVFTFMMARELSKRTLSADRRRRRPSPVSHNNNVARADREEGQDRHLSPRAVRAASSRSCKSTPDGDGTLLDHSLSSTAAA